ncbi:MAG: DNA (cytosine-5-)-methyltransferase [Bdellovibrionaceae bacterium]|nr:DNA (cytosine-5-)-methyltransferase [Pseudobdellovibrionaceae bacterium]
MKYLSLFSGIGGFEVGIRNSAPEWECIGYSEINKNSIEVYKSHFPNHINYGDIAKIQPDQIPDFDILTGGFPCQSYSIAGLRRGLDDPRGQLFFEILKIISHKKPKCIFLENVKGLASHDDGQTRWYIEQKIRECGYKVFSKVLNSADYGIPHNRERLYFVCFRNDLSVSEFNFPEAIPRYHSFKDFLEANPPDYVFLKAHQIRKIKGIGATNAFGGYLSDGLTYNCITASYSVDGGNSMKFFREGKVSALSAIECERLQAFPDNWTGILPLRHRYKTLGNAVTTNVIGKIAEEIDFTIRKNKVV